MEISRGLTAEEHLASMIHGAERVIIHSWGSCGTGWNFSTFIMVGALYVKLCQSGF